MLANQKPNSENTLEPVSCPQCGSFRSIAVFKGEDRLHSFPGEFHVAECSECGLWFQNPRPRLEQLSGFYPSDYAPHAQPALQPVPIGDVTRSYLVRVLGYSHLNSPRPRSWRSWPIFDFVRVRRGWLHLIPRFIPDGQLFEMGCGSGSQLLLLQQLGWGNLHGVELAPDAAAAARARGLDVQCGMVENALPEWPDGYFDVVIASMVLEHCVNPFDVLRMIARKIKPNGELLFSTVNRDSWDARWYGTYWRNLDLPRHTVWFRKSDLMAALVLNFQDIDVCYDAQPIDFLGSARYRAREKNALMDRAFERLGERGLRIISIMASAWGKSSRIFVRCKKSMHSSCP